MPSADAWAGNAFPLSTWTDDVSSSTDFARIIADKTQSITVDRLGVTQSAQTVRLETMTRGESTVEINGRQHGVDALVFGYNGHATITDTDLQPGDRFSVSGDRYEVIAVLVALDSVLQAFCEAKS